VPKTDTGVDSASFMKSLRDDLQDSSDRPSSLSARGLLFLTRDGKNCVTDLANVRNVSGISQCLCRSHGPKRKAFPTLQSSHFSSVVRRHWHSCGIDMSRIAYRTGWCQRGSVILERGSTVRACPCKTRETVVIQSSQFCLWRQ
jgi:hypothetical protein